ncbi:lyase family protein [Mesorhizobium sp. M0488]|uniref:lyase family protein n=1 Tax=unclassified Mesorhizobium TaxID=325217 RepID=UPI003336CAFD
MAKAHRATPMAGRTHLQHALPITFGYKAAVWLSALERHRERLAQMRPRVLVVQFSGASGTLASLGDRGLAVQEELARILELATPAITWHSSRDGMAEPVQLLALICGSLAKLAFDTSIMMATELGEVSEPLCAPSRRIEHHAAEAQSDLVRVHHRRRKAGAPACRIDARRNGARFRARLARGISNGGGPRSIRLTAGALSQAHSCSPG